MRRLLLLLVFISTSSLAQIPEKIISSGFWSDFDWSKVESTPLWNDGLLKQAESYSDTLEIKEKMTFFEGLIVTFSTNKLIGSKVGTVHYMQLSFKGTNYDNCDSMAQKYAKRLGIDSKKEDDTMEFVEGIKTLGFSYSKNIGSTQVNVSCSRIVSSASTKFVDSFSISFKKARPINKQFSLQCTRNVRLVNAYDEEPISPLSFVVRIDSNLILDLNRKFIAHAESINPEEIVFSLSNGNLETKYSINRGNGYLSASLFQSNEFSGNIRGYCSLYSDTKLF